VSRSVNQKVSVRHSVSEHSPTPGTSGLVEKICFIKNNIWSDTGAYRDQMVPGQIYHIFAIENQDASEQALSENVVHIFLGVCSHFGFL